MDDDAKQCTVHSWRFACRQNRFLVTVLAVTVVLAAAVPFLNRHIVYPAFTRTIVKGIEEDARRLGAYVRPPSLDNVAVVVDNLTERFYGEVFRMETSFGLLKVRIISADMTVLYSTTTAELGDKVIDPHVTEAVVHGEPSTVLLTQTIPTAGGDSETIDVVRTTIPYMFGDEFLGAFEMYYDITERRMRLERIGLLSTIALTILAAGLIGVVVVLFNKEISRQKAQERGDQLKDEVERITRHDLKTPIISVLSGILYLRRFTSLSSEQEEVIEDMHTAANRSMEMINRSLELYRMEVGTYEPEPERLDCMAVARQVTGDLSGLAVSSNVALRILHNGHPAAETDTVYVMGEEPLLYSVLANLIKNAIEASSPGDTVTVDLSASPQPRIVITNPTVVPPEMRDTFFDKYATAGKGDGTGLGTYSARLMTRTMGGTITMESSEEHGTTLTIQLPAVD